MKMTRIITAKIRPGIMMKISDGGKRFEVRMESFHDADFIRYVDADHPHTQFSDGLRRLGRERRFSRDSDEFVRELSGVDEETFKELFPRPSLWVPEFTHRRDYLFVAPIGEPIALGQIFPGEHHMSSQQDKRKALAKRLTSQTIQLTALNASINKLRKQELNHAQQRTWPYWQSPNQDTATSIRNAAELKSASMHLTNAINQLNALAAMLNEGSAYDE